MPSQMFRFPHKHRTAIVAALGACVLGLGGCSSQVSDRNVRRIELREVSRPVEREDRGTLIIDARSPGEFGAGHIPGARNIRSPDIDTRERDPELERFRTIIVYGNDPGSAPAVSLVKKMMIAGYKDVRLFEQGFNAWRNAGLPIERGGPGVRAESFGGG